MEIEAIAGITGVSPVSAAADSARAHHLSPTLAGLAEAKAREQETTAERAADGDPIAKAELAAESARATPDTSRGLEPSLPHPATTHEPGKGDRIDVYD